MFARVRRNRNPESTPQTLKPPIEGQGVVEATLFRGYDIAGLLERHGYSISRDTRGAGCVGRVSSWPLLFNVGAVTDSIRRFIRSYRSSTDFFFF